MKIELDIDKIVSDAITTALDPERLQKLIETQVTKVADSAIGSVFSDYGDFGKTVKKAVAELVPHDLALDKQTDWNHYVTTVMNQRLAAVNDARIAAVIQPMMDKILVQPPESIKLSEIIRNAVVYWNDMKDDFDGRPFLEISRSTGLTAGYTDIYIAQKRPHSKYSSDITLKTEEGGEVWGVKFHDLDISKSRFAGPMFNIEQQLFQLYACRTKIIIDIEDIDDVDLEFEDQDEDQDEDDDEDDD